MPWTYRFPISFREFGTKAVRLEVRVERASLHSFANALRGLKSDAASYVVIHAPGKTRTVELRHDPDLQFRPPLPIASRDGITWVEQHGSVIRIVLNDLDVTNMWAYYDNWLAHGDPMSPAVEFDGWYGDKHCYGYFTHDAPRDRTEPPHRPA